MNAICKLPIAIAIGLVLFVATPGQAEFQQGNLATADEQIESLEVTISVSKGAALQDPVGLDLGLGFPLWLHPLGRPAGAAIPFGAVPQQATSGEQLAADASATFTFRLSGEAGQDRFRTCPQLLAGVRVGDIARIGFLGTSQADWELKGFEIKVNGKLLASNDAVYQRPQAILEKARFAMADLELKVKPLETEIANLTALDRAKLATPADRAQLEKRQAELAPLTLELQRTQGQVKGTSSWYVEAGFKPLGRGFGALSTVKVTLITFAHSAADTQNIVYFQAGARKYPLGDSSRPLTAANGPQEFELDLAAGPLTPLDLRMFAVGMLGIPAPYAQAPDRWHLERLRVEADGTILYDSEQNSFDKRSLAAIRLIPPTHVDETGKIVSNEIHSEREVFVWVAGKGQGLNPADGTLLPLPIDPNAPDYPKPEPAGTDLVPDESVKPDEVPPDGTPNDILPDDTVEPSEDDFAPFPDETPLPSPLPGPPPLPQPIPPFPIPAPIPPTPQTGELSGRVLVKLPDGSSRGIVGAAIVLRESNGSAGGAVSVAEGQYRATLLAGTWRASVSANGYQQLLAPQDISILPGSTVQRDFVLERLAPSPGQGIRGKVTVAVPRGFNLVPPPADLKVTILSALDSSVVMGPLGVNGDGKFQQDLWEGSYLVRAQAAGYRTAISRPRAVLPGVFTEVNLLLLPDTGPAGFDLTVRVKAKSAPNPLPLEGAAVLLRGEQQSLAEAPQQKTNAEGVAVFRNLVEPGKYTVLAQHAGYQPRGQIVELPGAVHDIELVLAPEMEVPESVEVTGYVAYRNPASQTQYSGIPDVRLTWKPATLPAANVPIPSYSATTSRSGSFSLQLPSGDYTVQLALDSAKFEPLPDQFVRVVPGQKPLYFVAELKQPNVVTVEGYVLARSQQDSRRLVAVPGARVDWFAPKGLARRVTATAVTDAGGRFTVKILENLEFSYLVRVTAPEGFVDSSVEIRVMPGMERPKIVLQRTPVPQPSPHPMPHPLPVPPLPIPQVCVENGVVTLDSHNPQADLCVAPGGTLEVRLKLSAGTGYAWSMVSRLPQQTQLVSGPTWVQTSPLNIGAGGYTRFVYRISPQAQQSFNLTYQLKRPWENAPATQAVVSINVGPIGSRTGSQ